MAHTVVYTKSNQNKVCCCPTRQDLVSSLEICKHKASLAGESVCMKVNKLSLENTSYTVCC